MRHAVRLGAVLPSDGLRLLFVKLHHGQVVVQEVVITLNHLSIAHPGDGPLRRGAGLSHESDVSLDQRGGYGEVVGGDDTVSGHGLDTLLQLQLGLAGLVQLAAQQVGGGEGRHVQVEVGPAVGGQEEASVGLRQAEAQLGLGAGHGLLRGVHVW